MHPQPRGRISVVHVTPHLGGGVGQALANLAASAATVESDVQHSFVLLEEPQKTRFADIIRGLGCVVEVGAAAPHVRRLLASADIVQLEWWHHPAIFDFLCRQELPQMRLLVWCHVSGTHTPLIPVALIEASDKFVFTSPCSAANPYIQAATKKHADKLAVVSSGGVSGIPERQPDPTQPLRAAYVGSLNFSKMHPDYVAYLAAVALDGFQVRMIGDDLNRGVLESQCASLGRPDLLEFRGYTTDIVAELSSINVLAYLLNPFHYGTAENALLEAMALGIVPVVLDNLAETTIVEAGVTGLVVRTPQEFGQAVTWLSENPAERANLGAQASAHVRETFTIESMGASFEIQYGDVMETAKRSIDFASVLGRDPAEWFLSCQIEPADFESGAAFVTDSQHLSFHGLVEETKGSIFHFSRYFPDDDRLSRWAQQIADIQGG